MKYLKKYKIFENKIQDLEDILQELKDENFKIDIEEIFPSGSIKISICIHDEKGIHLIPFKFSLIEEYVRRIIDFLKDYKSSFHTYGVDTRFSDKEIDDLSEDTIILLNLWMDKKMNK